jgi:hypothetical protein
VRRKLGGVKINLEDLWLKVFASPMAHNSQGTFRVDISALTDVRFFDLHAGFTTSNLALTFIIVMPPGFHAI